jgi:hypothetical protein
MSTERTARREYSTSSLLSTERTVLLCCSGKEALAGKAYLLARQPVRAVLAVEAGRSRRACAQPKIPKPKPTMNGEAAACRPLH